MKLKIDQHVYAFEPIHVFRERYGIPKEFSLSTFEPKEWTGLGSLERAGDALGEIQRRVTNAVPMVATPPTLLDHADRLTMVFAGVLNDVNTSIGLREIEVDFAVAGFGDIVRAISYRLYQLHSRYRGDATQLRAAFVFEQVYEDWLNASVRLSANTIPYSYANLEFTVQVVYYAYGRVGMRVRTPTGVVYVTDNTLACPAAGYMAVLTQRIATLLLDSLLKDNS